MPRPKPPSSDEESFGQRLARLRKAAGYSQREFAPEIGISQRMLAYYEAQAENPPGHLLTKIADALRISTDQLLGRAPLTSRRAPRNERLLRRLRQVEDLPPKARQAVLETIDAFAAKYRNAL